MTRWIRRFGIPAALALAGLAMAAFITCLILGDSCPECRTAEEWQSLMAGLVAGAAALWAAVTAYGGALEAAARQVAAAEANTTELRYQNEALRRAERTRVEAHVRAVLLRLTAVAELIGKRSKELLFVYEKGQHRLPPLPTTGLNSLQADIGVLAPTTIAKFYELTSLVEDLNLDGHGFHDKEQGLFAIRGLAAALVEDAHSHLDELDSLQASEA
ncbi:MAG TPA: hypothetical protein VKS60_19410 [Stellaceae bacterium]|nr:hypothetical protein [Stellaceae bacterium]